MRTAADVARFLSDSSVGFQDFGDGLMVVTDAGGGLRNLAIKVQSDVVVFQLQVMNTPAPGSKGREALFEKLLRLNGEGLLHAAFAIVDDAVQLQAALPLTNLDSNELQAVLDDIGMAVSQHVPILMGTSS